MPSRSTAPLSCARPVVAAFALFVTASALTLVPPVARAQLVPDDEAVAAPGTLRDVVGAGARIVRAEDGHVRMVYGAHVVGSGERRERAIAIVRHLATELGMPVDVELGFDREMHAHGFDIVRLVRTSAGVRVRDAGAVVRFLADGAIDVVLAAPGAPGLAAGAITLDEARARAWAEEGGRAVHEIRPELFSTEDGLVPVFAVVTTRGPETSLRETLLDARDGTVVVEIPLVVDALGTVFENNRVTDAGMTTDVELTDLLSTTTLTGTYFSAINCAANSSGCTGTQAVADAAGDFLFPPELGSYTDAFAEVSAYHHASRVAAYMRSEHGLTWTCMGTTQMDLLVNYTEAPSTPYDNAAFSPGFRSRCGVLLFGQGITGDFAWDGDVVYHEFGHAVTDQVTDLSGFIGDTLGVSYEPSAVNEGSSDFWAGVVQGDGRIAESFMGAPGIGAHGSLRVISDDLTCPGSLIGEGHEDGRLWAGLGWQLREVLPPDVVEAMFFTTVATTDASPSLSDVALLMRATAMGMMAMGTLDAAGVAAVDAEIAERTLEGCRRIVPLDDFLEHRGYSGSEFFTGGIGRGIAPLHFSLNVPVDALYATILIGRATPAGNYRLHFRSGQPVRVGSRVTSSWHVDVGPVGAATLDDFTPLPLPRCGTLYVAVEVLDLETAGQSLFGVQASMELSGDPSATCPVIPDAGPPPGTDAGLDAGTTLVGMGSGCGCRTAPSSTAAAWLVPLAAALVVARRRRS